jgi:hypothetical protein
METLKRETRYEVYKYNQPELVEVMADNNGKVVMSYDKNSESWYMPEGTNSQFFVTESEAKDYLKSKMLSDNAEKIKTYLEHLWYNEEEKLKDFIPETLNRFINIGRNSAEVSYSEYRVLMGAIAGHFNINGISFRASEVSHIRFVNTEEFYNLPIVVLKCGKEVKPCSTLEKGIINSAFGTNNSERVYNI